jgi:hypothetical protein
VASTCGSGGTDVTGSGAGTGAPDDCSTALSSNAVNASVATPITPIATASANQRARA